MSSTKTLTPDLLFGVQIIGAVAFCGFYIQRSMTDVTGSSLVQFILVALYAGLHLALAYGSHMRAKRGGLKTRATFQATFTYGTWFVLIWILVLTVGVNPDYTWNQRETSQALVAVSLTLVVVYVSLRMNRSLTKDPMTKALLAIAFKSVPQALLAFKFLAEGSSGTPLESVIVGHATIWIRLGQLYFMPAYDSSGKPDPGRKWLFVSEGVNELSWIIATIAWWYMR